MSFCIVVALRTATTSPSLTAPPGLTGILTIRPCIGAITVPSPARGGAGLAAATEPAAGTTTIPAPLTRTLNTSPSTSTSNSAPDEFGGGDGGGAGAGAGADDGASP